MLITLYDELYASKFVLYLLLTYKNRVIIDSKHKLFQYS